MTAQARTRLEKGASDSLTMGFGIDDYLQSGETIDVVSSPTVSPSGLTITGQDGNASSETFFNETVTAGRAIMFTCASGTAGTEYSVTFSFTTSTGDTKSAKCIVVVLP